MKLLLAGFVLSLLGSLPPGLINLSVAYIAIRRSFFAAMALGAGAAFAEYFQALIAVALVGVMPKLHSNGWLLLYFFLSAFICYYGHRNPDNPMKLMKYLYNPILTEGF
jgi:threonine/homoserine/homoserine lactone efflux protein